MTLVEHLNEDARPFASIQKWETGADNREAVSMAGWFDGFCVNQLEIDESLLGMQK